MTTQKRSPALTADGFDSALIGYGSHFTNEVAIYDHGKCLDILKSEGVSEEDALEFMDFNVTSAWVGGNTPVFLRDKQAGYAQDWDSVRRIQAEVSSWADSVFPHRSAHDALCKLMLEEIPEFALAQKDASEYADLVILILDIATLNGIDVAQAVKNKMSINRNRKWEINDNGLMRHTDV